MVLWVWKRNIIGQRRTLESVTKNLDKWLEKLNIKISILLLQKTALLGTARTLRKVLEF